MISPHELTRPRAAFLAAFFIVAASLLFACAARAPSSPATATARSTSEASVEWHVVIGKDFKIDERVCWRGLSPEAVVEPEMTSGAPFTKKKASRSREKQDGCIDLAIDLDAMARSLHDETAVTRIGDENNNSNAAIYGSFDPWLWRPRPWPKGMSGRLFLEAAPGISVSLPHARDDRGAYIIPISTWSFMARFAIGHLTVDEHQIAGGQLSIVTLPGATTGRQKAAEQRFIDGAALAVASVDSPPKMPTDRIQILLRAGGRGRRREADPVQFGMAMRGGGASVSLLINPTATEEELYGEWIATHELSHLWLPPVDREGAWLSEGLASYYQCILRSRAGMYDEARAWDELVSGFERGRAQAGSRALKDAQRPSFQHIYWGGAAIGLKLDVMLRKHGSSIDAAVAAVRRSMDDSQDRSAEDMLRLLSKPSGLDLVSPVHEWLAQPFPDTSQELRDLGVTQRAAGEVIVLSDQAPLANTRKAIAARR